MQRRTVALAGDIGQAAVGLEQPCKTWIVAVRAGLAETGDAQDDQLSLRRPQRLLAEVPALQRAGPVVLDQHVVAGDDLYGGTYRLFERVRKRSAGHAFTFVDMSNIDDVKAALRPETRMVWVETPSNPLLKLADLEAIAKLCRARNIVAVADNTFASPWVQRPLELGFDVVVHSTTKYLNGHSDVIGGVAVVADGAPGSERLAALREQLGFWQNAVGSIAGPFDSFLTLRGIKTLACECSGTVRMRSAWRSGSKRSRRSSAFATRGYRRILNTRWPASRCTATAE